MKKQSKPIPEKKPIPTPVTPITSVQSPTPSSNIDFLEKNGLFIFIGLLIFALFNVFRDYIFGEKLYLFTDIGSDTVNGIYPMFVQYVQYFKTIGIPKWTFSQGIGQGIFPANLPDVANWMLYLGEAKDVAGKLIYVQLFKYFFAGLFFYLYLQKLKLAKYTAILGGLMYAFSGFMMACGSWFLFATEGCYFAFFLYTYECLYQDDNWILFPLAVALAAAFNPVLLYMMVLFLGISMFVQFLSAQVVDWKKNGMHILKTSLLGFIGVLLSSVFLFSNLFMMVESPRGNGEASIGAKLMSRGMFHLDIGHLYLVEALRTFAADAVGTAVTSTYRGWQNYLEDPVQYAGLACLLLLPQLFQFLNKKQRIAYGVVFGIIVFTLVFPYFRMAIWLFTGDYFRTYSLLCTAALLVASLRALSGIIQQNKIQLPLLVITLLSLMVFLLIAASHENSPVNQAMKLPLIFFLTVEAITLYLITHKSYRTIGTTLFAVLILFELIYTGSVSTGGREALKKEELEMKIHYNDYTVEAMQYLKEHDKGFFRLHKDFSSSPSAYSSLNNALIQQYYGSQSYHSFNQNNYVRFLTKMNLFAASDEFSTRWINGVRARPLLMELIGNKYLLYKNNLPELKTMGYDSVTTTGEVHIYRNQFALPIGFGYKAFLTESEMDGLGKTKDNFILRGCVVPDEAASTIGVHTHLNLSDSLRTENLAQFDSLVCQNLRDTFQTTKFSENHIEGNINLPEPEVVFFSIPFDKGWTATIDGKETKPMRVNYGFLGFPLLTGTHNLVLTYEPPMLRLGSVVSVLGLLFFGGLLFFKRKIAPIFVF